MFIVMTTWRRGRELCARDRSSGLALQPFIETIAEHPPLRVPGTAVFLTAEPERVPHALLHNLKHNKVLHERNVLLTVEMLETPTADPERALAIDRTGRRLLRPGAALWLCRGPEHSRRTQKCPWRACRST